MLLTCDLSQYLFDVFALQDVVFAHMPINTLPRSWSRWQRTARIIRLDEGIEAVFGNNCLQCGIKSG